MKSKTVKVISLLLSVILIGIMFAGCGANNASPTQTTVEVTESQNTTTQDVDKPIYPISTDVTLTYWCGMQLPSGITNAKDTPFMKELMRKTGVKLSFVDQAQMTPEQFSIMLASGDLPDIIESSWATIPGGPDKAISEGQIIKLNDVIDKYAPNLKKIIDDQPDVAKMIKTDSGTIYNFPSLQPESISVYYGPIIRKDWLDDLGLQAPTTIDEWYNVLKAFKDKKGAIAPLTMPLGSWVCAFAGAYGAVPDFYIDNGKVVYGPIQPGFKDFLTTFNKWYNEGLLDKNFASADNSEAYMLGGKTGAVIGYLGGNLGAWTKAMKDKDPKFSLAGVQYPVLKSGDKPEFGQKDFNYVSYGFNDAISAKCKNVDIAAKFLDYAYSQEGHMLYNFGTEGVSYTMVGGYPTYTDLIMKNPDGLTMVQVLGNFTRAISSGPYYKDTAYGDQYFALQNQKDAQKAWANTNQMAHAIPPIAPTAEENDVITKSTTDIATYVSEMMLKFIMGAEPLSNYDKFVEQVKNLKVENVIAAKQTALDRYNKR